MWGSATTLTPASATSSATAALLVERGADRGSRNGWRWRRAGNRRARRWRAPRARTPLGSSVSSVWRSTGNPNSVASWRKKSVALSLASPSRCGQPPTRSAPASSASRSSARFAAPAAPVIGQPHSATIWTSITSATRRLTSSSASMLRSPCSCVVSAWLRTAREPVGGHQPSGALGALDDVRHVEQVPVGLHRQDRAHQVAGRVLDALGEEGLVEVGVGLDGGRRAAASRRGRRSSSSACGVIVARDGVDRLAGDPDVDDVTVDDRRALQDRGAHVCDDNDPVVVARSCIRVR